MRIAVVTESFLPQINGVSNSVVRTSEELQRRGHRLVIVAPGRSPENTEETGVIRAPAVPLPWYREVKIGFSSAIVDDTLRQFRPDVIHLASPVVMGAAALRTARELNFPAVAVYQTDLPRYASTYRLPFGRPAAWRWLRRVHNRSDLTLAPSNPVADELLHRGFRRVRVWGRGVEVDLFHPRHRSDELRRSLAPSGELIVGYVGRIARDKEVGHLSHVSGLRGTRLVVVGDGPLRSKLEGRLHGAIFTGFLRGEALARMYASFDVLVHTGRHDTFGQVLQESLAAGTPVLGPSAGGPLDLIRNGENGLFWPADDPTRIGSIVESLVHDRGLVERLAANARSTVEDRTWSRLVDELEWYYRSISYREAIGRAA